MIVFTSALPKFGTAKKIASERKTPVKYGLRVE